MVKIRFYLPKMSLPIFKRVLFMHWKILKNFDLNSIEVQSGTYLGEDDIVRIENRYGRVAKDLMI